MTRKLILFLITLFLILTSIPFATLSETATVTDNYGIIYAVSDEGTHAVAIDGRSASGTVTMPSIVTIGGKRYYVYEIGYGAFRNSAVSKIVFKSTTKKIGTEAFAGCNSLATVNFYNSKVAIGDRCFAGCVNLSDVTSYGSIQYIGAGVFEDTAWYKNNLNSLTATDGSVYIGKALYKYVGSARNLTIGSTILSISPTAFEGNSTLENITLGSGVTSIGNAAFRNCSALTSFKFNSTLETIGDSAFDGCKKLMGTLVLPSTTKSIGGYAFRKTAYSSANLSALSLTTVENGLFQNCTSLKSAKFGSSVTTVGKAAFAGASALTEISLPSATHIEYDAFRGCTSLANKNAFSSVNYIGTGAFDGTGIYKSANGKACIIGNVLYKTEENDISNFAVQNGVKSVSPYALYAADKLSTLAIPSSLEEIDTESIPLSENTDIFLFSENSKIYNEFSDVGARAIFIPDGKTLDAQETSVGTIKGITVERYPEKVSYLSEEAFDPSGIIVNLNTLLDGKEVTYNVGSIGYEPTYSYDFSKSHEITVDYCGYTAKIDLSKSLYVVGAQLRTESEDKARALRFIAEYADAYALNYENCEFGFVVIPEEFVPEGESVEAGKTYTVNGKQYATKTVPAVKLFGRENGSVTYTVCITGTKAENYDRVYISVPYIKRPDGTYIYGKAYSTSLVAVAQEILNDNSASDEETNAAKQIIEENIK